VESSLIRGEALRVVVGGRELLANVQVSACSGEILGVLGRNGAGKTTLLRVLAGDMTAGSGRVWLGDTDVSKLPLWQRARRGLGYMPQVPSVLFDLTVEENIRTFVAAGRVEPRPPHGLAERFGLETRLPVRARDLSGGERRRLELLRAIVGEPKVLLCDEPFAAGDPEHVRLVVEHLRTIADAGGTVIVADHRTSDTLALCHRAMLLVNGAIEAQGAASSFRDHPAVQSHSMG
jgi:lipopolysaccharide export system ATP-binding protein